MCDHPSESQNDGLDDLGAEIYAAPPVTQLSDNQQEAILRELDSMGLDDLELGDGPFDPGPNMTADELAEMAELEKRREAEAELAPIMDDLIVQYDAEKADPIPTPDEPNAPKLTPLEAQEQHRERFIANLNGPKPKTARKSQLSPRQAEIIEYRKSPEGKPLWNDYQNEKRWAKAELEGRAIIRRKSLKDMTPEEKAERERAQAAERQRKRRAAQKAANATT